MSKKEGIKFRDLLTGEYKERFEYILNRAKNEWLVDLEKVGNGISHSKNIEDYLDQMVPDDMVRKEKFTESEIFLLLCATYLHDIGKKECIEKKGEEKRKCIDKHAETTYNKITENLEKYRFSDIGKQKMEGIAVALICKSHNCEGKEINNLKKKFPINGTHANLRMLASMLIIADEVDHRYTRVSGVKKSTIRSRVIDVVFNHEKRVIEIYAYTDSKYPKIIDDIFELKIIEAYTQKRLKEIEIYLPEELQYTHVNIIPEAPEIPNFDNIMLTLQKFGKIAFDKIITKNPDITMDDFKSGRITNTQVFSMTACDPEFNGLGKVVFKDIAGICPEGMINNFENDGITNTQVLSILKHNSSLEMLGSCKSEEIPSLLIQELKNLRNRLEKLDKIKNYKLDKGLYETDKEKMELHTIGSNIRKNIHWLCCIYVIKNIKD